jgi:dienelactone hydrolase
VTGKMVSYRIAAGLLIAGLVILSLFGSIFSSGSISAANGKDWTVNDGGILAYSVTMPKYNLSEPEDDGNSTLSTVLFESRDMQMAGLLRIPRPINSEEKSEGVPGIVLLPGATVTKEREQGLAKHLADIGYATLTLDQRNLGAFDAKGDLQLFMRGDEPTEYKMVYDALAAAEILRVQPGIDPDRVVYAGESNGGRFAIIACALDTKARGILAISTSGYGTDAAIASTGIADRDTIRFYRSIDPETYLAKITPRPFAMIHSRNDTVIPFQLAERTYAMASQPKSFDTVGCTKHGYCSEMNDAIEKDLRSFD